MIRIQDKIQSGRSEGGNGRMEYVDMEVNMYVCCETGVKAVQCIPFSH